MTRATLQLYAAGWGGTNISIGAYAISRTVTMSQSTWNQAQAGNPWGSPGCNNTATDRRPNPESLVTTSGVGKWYSFDLTALVQEWVNGSVPNNGVLMRAASSSAYAFYFASTEHSTAELRPKLVITYTVSTGPITTATPTSGATHTPTRTLTQTPTKTLTPTIIAPSTFTPTPTQSATPTALPGAETTIVLQQGLEGYSGAEDTYIYQYDPDNLSYYTSTLLKVGYKQQFAALLRFDLSSYIPQNAIITRATL
ncbi:MAG: DNRLRE domain-containing protein, partial [Anaerolineae bacterium]